MSLPPDAAAITNIGQIAIRVLDIDRAVSFYRDTLGLRFLFAAPGDLAFFDCGGVRLMLSKSEQGEHDHPASILYYRVGDIHAAFAAVRDGGARVEGEPHLVAKLPDHDLWIGFLRDSEDNVFALMSEVRAA
jgi:methylmalonyl-CoA/ethylmalonyl-CoA epimerase